MSTPKKSIKERFFSFVDKQPGDNGCWLWKGALNEAGYGKFHVSPDLGTLLAHRWAYMMETMKPLPEDVVLDHICRVRRCVRNLHLAPVTQTINTDRGDSITAQNKRKDTCKHGHSLTGANVYSPPSGGRACRICMRRSNKVYGQRRPDKVRDRVRRFRQRHGPPLVVPLP